jgi:glyoxylase-like metal-dependent hydrolase (beta-lactamase superfamily II)
MSPSRRHGRTHLRQLMAHMHAPRETYTLLAEDARREPMPPAAEWLLDNFHIATAAARDIQHDLPPASFEISGDPRQGAPTINRFTVPGEGSVNTYWIEGPQGLIVVDYQRDLDSAREALAQVARVGKPVVAMLLTHAHPDHIGGLQLFKRAYPEATLYASKATADDLRNDTQGYQKLSREILKDKAPSGYATPDHVFGVLTRLEIGGLDVEAHELGPSEATSATVYYLPASGDMFGGDIAINQMTDFLLEGRTKTWLAQIETLRNAYPDVKTLFPGHGPPAEAARLFDRQVSYLTFIRDAVATQIAAGRTEGSGLSPSARRDVADAVTARFGDNPAVAIIPGLGELNVDAVAKEMLAELPQQ